MDKFMDASAEPVLEPEDETAENPETVADITEVAATETAPVEKRVKRRRERKPQKEGRKSSQGTLTLRQVAERFAACGRCSYFWAGYRVLCGEAGQETAVAESDSGWLDLDWHVQMPRLLYKSYGVRLDIEHFHYEGCCKECHRRFVYQAAESEDEFSSCIIEVSPRSGG